jgi:hypothetical protein
MSRFSKPTEFLRQAQRNGDRPGEVPNSLIGEGKVHAWATTSLYGHAPEIQVQRRGLHLITHIFLSASDDPKDSQCLGPL